MAIKTDKRRVVRGTSPEAGPLDILTSEEPVDKIAAYLNFGTPEELEQDAAEWRSIVANSTDEQLAQLEKEFREGVKKRPAAALDFKGK